MYYWQDPSFKVTSKNTFLIVMLHFTLSAYSDLQDDWKEPEAYWSGKRKKEESSSFLLCLFIQIVEAVLDI